MSKTNVADPQTLYADPDPVIYFNADPDSVIYFNADPDPVIYFNADPDPDQALLIPMLSLKLDCFNIYFYKKVNSYKIQLFSQLFPGNNVIGSPFIIVYFFVNYSTSGLSAFRMRIRIQWPK